MERNVRTLNDDFIFAKTPKPSQTAMRTLIIPQEVSGEGGGAPWWVWALLIAGVGWLILKEEKIV